MFGFKSKERKTTDFFLNFADYCAKCFVFDDDPDDTSSVIFSNELEAPLALNSRLKNAGFDGREQIIFSIVVLTAVTTGVMRIVAKARLNEKELQQYIKNNLPGDEETHFLHIACEETITSTTKRWFGDAASSDDISLYFSCTMRDPTFRELTSRGLGVFNRWLVSGWHVHKEDLGKIAMSVYIREIYDDEDLISKYRTYIEASVSAVDESRREWSALEDIEDPDERSSELIKLTEERTELIRGALEQRESHEDSSDQSDARSNYIKKMAALGIEKD